MVDLEPALPRVRGDRTHLQEALLIMLTAAVRAAADGAQLRLEGGRVGDLVRLTLAPGTASPTQMDRAVAARIITVMGGHLDTTAAELRIELQMAVTSQR